MKRILISLLMLFALSVSLAWAQTTVPPAPASPAIHGQGTQAFVPVFRSPTSIGNSQIFQSDGGLTGPQNSQVLLGIGTKNPQATLHVNYGDSGNYNSFMLGNCENGGKCFFVTDGGGAIDMVSYTALHMNAADIYLNPWGDGSDWPTRQYVGIGTTEPTNILTIKNGRGPAIADGWAVYSSRRWKTNIQPLDGALSKVNLLRGVSFDWKGTGKHDIGLVAEEVAKVLPEVVSFEKDGQDARSVDYGRLTAVLVEAIKTQQIEIDALKAQLSVLTNRSE